MGEQEERLNRIAEVKEKIAELRKLKPMCTDTWDKEFELMELEDELAELTAGEVKKG